MMNNEVASLMNNEKLWYIFFENMFFNNIGEADTSIIHYSFAVQTAIYRTAYIGELSRDCVIAMDGE